ncbi:hypothetical protein VOLCADRAFT_95169 [Volvox carteri f. nagariensis]|uniref:Uncharacterized protein n=1 Tax=Volvox carteri f. nagariensis TaxID=3068 RepID=D8U6S8_VOLCA|nr:uncharacterized protein VOLCADRAFT_95169 [Volvox carteri f. nagariensis]EFJ44563.1 hypothetical protein VOLCADRAFT_95169 [Volvox carteri f. nagariensis]|eukprot:XP_002954413.1 hypothetical protein VOLCADRAFT_95169 [Volvox carteri f. nagariensis]
MSTPMLTFPDNVIMPACMYACMYVCMPASHAAHVRHILTCSRKPAIQVAGHLALAAAIAGARSLEGGLAKAVFQPMGPPPNGYQGWGRIDLSRTLPLPGLTPGDFKIQVADRGTIATGDVFYLPGLRATGMGRITATLVWHDYPGEPSSMTSLVNDLDFYYTLNDNTTWRQIRPDTVNNVERIELHDLAVNDRITFIVHGREIRHQMLSSDPVEDTTLPQYWAVVVVGSFTGFLQTPLNPVYMRPQRLQNFISTSQQMDAISFHVRLREQSCLGRQFDSYMPIALRAGCDKQSAVVQFREVEGSDEGGKLYTYNMVDYLGLCLTAWGGDGSSEPSIFWANCSGDSAQEVAVYVNPHNTSSSAYRIAPWLLVNKNRASWLCLRAPALAGLDGNELAPFTLAPCDDDDKLQSLELAAMPPALLFRAEWYSGPNVSTADLDLVVTWKDLDSGLWYSISAANPNTHGGLHNVDNAKAQPLATNFEEVYWPYEQQPDVSTYYVCVRPKVVLQSILRVVLYIKTVGVERLHIERKNMAFSALQYDEVVSSYCDNAKSPRAPKTPPPPEEAPPPDYIYQAPPDYMQPPEFKQTANSWRSPKYWHPLETFPPPSFYLYPPPQEMEDEIFGARSLREHAASASAADSSEQDRRLPQAAASTASTDGYLPSSRNALELSGDGLPDSGNIGDVPNTDGSMSTNGPCSDQSHSSSPEDLPNSSRPESPASARSDKSPSLKQASKHQPTLPPYNSPQNLPRRFQRQPTPPSDHGVGSGS